MNISEVLRSPYNTTGNVAASAYKASRFGSPPVRGGALPDGNPADAGPTNADRMGQISLTSPTDEDYYLTWLDAGVRAFWFVAGPINKAPALDASADALRYAPIASPAFTGTFGINGNAPVAKAGAIASPTNAAVAVAATAAALATYGYTQAQADAIRAAVNVLITDMGNMKTAVDALSADVKAIGITA